MWLLYKFYAETEHKARNYALSVLCFVLAIMAKAISMSFLPMACALIAMMHSEGKLQAFSTPAFWRKSLRDGAIFVVLGMAFLLVRKYVIGIEGQPAFGAARYEMNIGKNLLINPLQTVFAVFQPLSTADVFGAVKYRDWALLTLAVVLFADDVFESCQRIVFLQHAAAACLAFGIKRGCALGTYPQREYSCCIRNRFCSSFGDKCRVIAKKN